MTEPELSVVLATRDRFATIATTVRYLAAQSAVAAIELIVVAPARRKLEIARELETTPGLVAGFAAFAVVEVGAIDAIAGANAAGIRAARAPIVALAEDHAFPSPDWAERLIAAHRGPWAAVGPAVANANPRSLVSWADLFIGYGPWLAPQSSREIAFLPGHNSSYKRDRLLAYGDALEEMMAAETVLHWDLTARGERLYLEAAAVVRHTNFSRLAPWLRVQYHNGRLFAGARARGMSLTRRLVYVAGSPLIPLVRLARTVRAHAAGALAGRLARCAPALIVGLGLDGLGQAVGYACGVGGAGERVAEFEFRREDHVTARDRAELFA